MKKIVSAVAFALASMTLAGSATAQFSLPSLGGLTSGGANQADLSGQQTALVKNFVAANVDVLKANAKMSEALGLKAKAADAEAVVQQLSSGATVDKDSASTAAAAVSDTSGAIAAKLAEKPALDSASKATFTQGLVSLASGMVKYTGMNRDVSSMADGLKSASPTQLPSLGSAAYVVTKFPGSATEVAKALKNAIDFARSNNIEVPADATKALAAL